MQGLFFPRLFDESFCLEIYKSVVIQSINSPCVFHLLLLRFLLFYLFQHLLLHQQTNNRIQMMSVLTFLYLLYHPLTSTLFFDKQQGSSDVSDETRTFGNLRGFAPILSRYRRSRVLDQVRVLAFILKIVVFQLIKR